MPSSRRAPTRPTLCLVAALGVCSLVLSGCNSTQTSQVQPPAQIPTPVSSAVANVPQQIDNLTVAIRGGKFDARSYEAQEGQAVQMTINLDGGPYTFSIDSVVTSRQLPASGSTQVGFVAPKAGSYTMHADGPGGETDTATLLVRAAGNS